MNRTLRLIFAFVIFGLNLSFKEQAVAQAVRVPHDLLDHGCQLIGGVQGKYRCFTSFTVTACRRMLLAGDLKYCEGEHFNRTSRGARRNRRYPKQEVEVGDHYSFVSSSSDAAVTVYQNRRGTFDVSGAGEYHVFFNTPNLGRSTRAECDAHACGIAQSACERSCAYADKFDETRTGDRTGESSLVRASFCGEEVSGFLEVNSDNALTAWSACNSRQAWGNTITFQMKRRVGMVFTMNNLRTVVSNRGNHCDFRNHAIPYMYSRVISIPATVNCAP